jgi:TldD protein
VAFAPLQTAQLGRSLSQIADQEGDHADLYLERCEAVEVPENDESPGVLVRREQGFAVRLLRQGRTWLASRDRLDSSNLRQALRQVARAVPNAAYMPEFPLLEASTEPFAVDDVLAFPSLVREQIRQAHIAFPARFHCARHRRLVQVVGTRFVSEAEQEQFYSFVAELPWIRYGVLLARFDEAEAQSVVETLLDSFRAREAPPPGETSPTTVLGPAATAVLLHEAVAHALEADTLSLGGRAESACGYRLGSELLSILDDPRGAPEGVSRFSDDEGIPTIRRWLLQQGEIREPLADVLHAGQSLLLSPGAARRGDRHLAPVPRSLHLELLPGQTGSSDLLAEAEGGLYFPLVSRGALDPLSGEVEVHFPYGRRISGGQLSDYVGPCRLRGTVATLLQAVTAVGSDQEFAGAGWCAKGGHRLAVWATCPALRLEGPEVEA